MTESPFERAKRFARALVVGAGATLVDVTVLSACIRLVGLAPATARLPALAAGACVQFFGNRTFTFRAQRGKLTRQARLFLVFEAATLVLNASIYRVFVPHAGVIPPEIVSFAGTFVVFIGFAYPIRKLVIFRLREGE